MFKRLIITICAFMLLLALPYSKASAQDVRPTIEQNQVSYSEMELLQFAEALQEVMQIIDQHQSSLQAVPSGSKAESQLIDAITEEANHAIAEKGLAVSRFNEILRAFQMDPNVAVRVQQHLTGVQI